MLAVAKLLQDAVAQQVQFTFLGRHRTLPGCAARLGLQAKALLEQRVTERIQLLAGLLETSRLYRTGLLVQSETTVRSALAVRPPRPITWP